ncbi:hypothetical protein ACFWHG_19275 [Streptomyces microflavus]|uniref:hypothetical protein n=1 Tax=Streptomyces microflavus TaxID=1919 RepID=UPI00364F6AC8
MSNHLTQHRIAAALAAVTQPEGERPWTLLLTKPPLTHADARMAIHRRRSPDSWPLFRTDEATVLAEASRAEIIQELARRDGYLAALSAAEHILSTTPVLPTDVDVRLAPWDAGPHLVINFHKDPAAVHAFAAHFGTEVSEVPHSEGSVRIETTGITETGVRFEAYTLIDAPAVAE